MGIRDWFRLAKSKSATKLSHVEKQLHILDQIKNQEKIADVAKKSAIWQVRAAAVSRLTDVHVLKAIEETDTDSRVKATVYRRSTELDSSSRVKATAYRHTTELDQSSPSDLGIDQISDQTELAEIARNHTNESARLAAVEKLTDKDLLTEILRSAEGHEVRRAAAIGISKLADVHSSVPEESISKKEDNSVRNFENGKQLLINGNLDEAIIHFKEALNLNPNISDKIYNVAHMLHSGARSKNEAIGGNVYYSDGILELDSAIAVLELLSEFEPHKADIWFKLGVLFDNRCNFDKAISAYERAASLDANGPDGADALINLGGLFFNKGKGILGTKKEDASGYFGFSANQNDAFVNAEKTALKALVIAKKAFLVDQSYRNNLINAHKLLREIYSTVVFEDKNNEQAIMKGAVALEHCLEMYKLDPNDSETITWLKQAEKNTGKHLL